MVSELKRGIQQYELSNNNDNNTNNTFFIFSHP